MTNRLRPNLLKAIQSGDKSAHFFVGENRSDEWSPQSGAEKSIGQGYLTDLLDFVMAVLTPPISLSRFPCRTKIAEDCQFVDTEDSRASRSAT